MVKFTIEFETLGQNNKNECSLAIGVRSEGLDELFADSRLPDHMKEFYSFLFALTQHAMQATVDHLHEAIDLFSVPGSTKTATFSGPDADEQARAAGFMVPGQISDTFEGIDLSSLNDNNEEEGPENAA